MVLASVAVPQAVFDTRAVVAYVHASPLPQRVLIAELYSAAAYMKQLLSTYAASKLCIQH